MRQEGSPKKPSFTNINHTTQFNNMAAQTIFRAQYQWALRGKILVIEDIGTECRSLTNDIENCLAEIALQLPEPITTYDIIYKDSGGTWDGVLVVNYDERQTKIDLEFLKRNPTYVAKGIEFRFYYIGQTTEQAAKQRIRQRVVVTDCLIHAMNGTYYVQNTEQGQAIFDATGNKMNASQMPNYQLRAIFEQQKKQNHYGK